MKSTQKARRAARRPYDDDVDALGNAREGQRTDDVGVTDCDALGWTTRLSTGWCGPDGERYDDVAF